MELNNQTTRCLISDTPIASSAVERGIYIYQCFYYHPDDEYGLPQCYGMEVKLFHDKQAAIRYKQEFEAVSHRRYEQPWKPSILYTKYEGEILNKHIQ